jgi:hypothetical protein
MLMLTFGCAVLLMYMWARHTVWNPNFLKEIVKTMVLTAPIILDMNNLMIEKTLNMCLKLK